MFFSFPISDFPYSSAFDTSSKTSPAKMLLFTKKFRYPPTTSIFSISLFSSISRSSFSFISFAITGGAFFSSFASLKHGKE